MTGHPFPPTWLQLIVVLTIAGQSAGDLRRPTKAGIGRWAASTSGLTVAAVSWRNHMAKKNTAYSSENPHCRQKERVQPTSKLTFLYCNAYSIINRHDCLIAVIQEADPGIGRV